MSNPSLDGSQATRSVNTESLSQDDQTPQSRNDLLSMNSNRETRPANKYGVMKPYQVTMMSLFL
ncbi:hypothetical protein SI65_03903 [Aspergillus cristatus]|uniref:Uncharacterized protein n=1 Tax=Aspergillus cristatus TaxID=573508 RepID=A0A1E3BIR3_ASPCR|nr:hypothetical protein SI65_03903 [Aspergillus cristatus]